MNETDLSGEVQAIATAMAGLFVARERSFSKIGESLMEAMSDLGQLTAAFEALPSALDREELHRAAELLHGVGLAIGQISLTLKQENAMLADLVVANRDVAGCLDNLQQSIRVMSILTLHAKIEASSIDAGNQAFSSFTAEIAQLAKVAQTSVEGYVAEHGRLVSLLAAASAEQSRFQRRYQGKLATIVGDLEAALSAVEARRHQTSAAAGEIARRSRQISDTVGLLVFDLQIGDTTRQRIEHVETALATLGRGLAPAQSDGAPQEAWSAGLDVTQRLAITLFVCAMLAAQIRDAAQEFDAKVDKIHGSLRDLTQEAGGIARLGAELYGSKGGAATSFLAVLEKQLGLGFEIVRDCSAALADLDRTTATVATATMHLRQQVSSIGQIVLNMRLVGMNAALKSKQIGASGRGLGAIAEQLRSYANETVNHADALLPALGKVIETTESFDKMRMSRGDDILARLDAEMAAALVGFDECSAQLDAALAALGHHGDRVGSIIERSVAQVAAQGGLANLLRNARLKLSQLGGAPEARRADAEAMMPLLAELARLYTMAREREIHAQFAPLDGAGAKEPSTAGVAAATPDSSDDGALLGDILFA